MEAGKGDRSRVQDRKRYERNMERIRWRSSVLVDESEELVYNYTTHEFIRKRDVVLEAAK